MASCIWEAVKLKLTWLLCYKKQGIINISYKSAQWETKAPITVGISRRGSSVCNASGSIEGLVQSNLNFHAIQHERMCKISRTLKSSTPVGAHAKLFVFLWFFQPAFPQPICTHFAMREVAQLPYSRNCGYDNRDTFEPETPDQNFFCDSYTLCCPVKKSSFSLILSRIWIHRMLQSSFLSAIIQFQTFSTTLNSFFSIFFSPSLTCQRV